MTYHDDRDPLLLRPPPSRLRRAHPHGHNGLVEIELKSEALDARGMVFDFGDVKRDVKAWIDATMDHQMILRKDDPLVEWLEKQPYMTLDDNPTAENIARAIYDHVRARDTRWRRCGCGRRPRPTPRIAARLEGL